MELPPLFPDLEPGGRVRFAATRLSKKERKQREIRIRQALRKSGQPVNQASLCIRWRTSSKPIKRRIHEQRGNAEFKDTPLPALAPLLVELMRDAVEALSSDFVAIEEKADIAAWIDLEGEGPTGARTAATHFLEWLQDATGETFDIDVFFERLRRKAPELSLMQTPRAFAIYLAAYLGG